MRSITAALAKTLSLMLVACTVQGATSVPEEPVATRIATALPAPTLPEIMMTATAASPALEPTVVVTVVDPTEEPSEVPTSTVEAVDTSDEGDCLECHKDKERLIQTAAPEEETPVSESSGVG